jgi:hypothetical protein
MTMYRLTGRVGVPLPPDRAFRLFTPLGERDWAAGWDPTFPAGTAGTGGTGGTGGDDSAPGTVFLTGSGDHSTIWVVTAREPGRLISYARTTPGDRAGTVTVTLAPARSGTEATVVYHLTALTEAAEDDLAAFAANYDDYLVHWQAAIAAAVHAAP